MRSTTPEQNTDSHLWRDQAAWCLQSFSTAFYVVFSVVLYVYLGPTVASPALLSLQPTWAKATFGIALGNFLLCVHVFFLFASAHPKSKLTFANNPLRFFILSEPAVCIRTPRRRSCSSAFSAAHATCILTLWSGGPSGFCSASLQLQLPSSYAQSHELVCFVGLTRPGFTAACHRGPYLFVPDRNSRRSVRFLVHLRSGRLLLAARHLLSAWGAFGAPEAAHRHAARGLHDPHRRVHLRGRNVRFHQGEAYGHDVRAKGLSSVNSSLQMPTGTGWWASLLRAETRFQVDRQCEL